MQSIDNKNKFIGRLPELQHIAQAANSHEASILIVYGRRRIGKTELIEHALRDRHLIKLEGVEGGDTKTQIHRVMYQLSQALKDPLISRLQFDHWFECFDFIADKLAQGQWTLYFEEVQWLANYKNEFLADLKLIWDNKFRHNPELLLVLCGSSPSFMINQVVHSKALYNRSTYEINLQPFSLLEAKEFLVKRSHRELMNAYLTIGGVPEYLKRINQYTSIEVGLCKTSFMKDAYLSKEHERIFISSFATNVHYKDIIEFLSHVKFATRKEIEDHLGIHGGGKLTDVLKDLELCGFIEVYSPYFSGAKSKLRRYAIADAYLHFYYKFIKPYEHRIDQGDFNQAPDRALNKESYQKWLGFAFERFCRKNHRIISEKMGFSAVRYQSGVYFDRATDMRDKGFQIDLIFDRADHVITVCEIKYLQGKVGVEVIDEFEKKMDVVRHQYKNTIEKVLIAANGASDSLLARQYFDRILVLEDLVG